MLSDNSGRTCALQRPRRPNALGWIGATLLVACGGSNSAQNKYTVGVSVSGLSGSGLVLQLNMDDDLPIPASGIATFGTTLTSGASYNVSVKTQPTSPSQTCQVSNGTGTGTVGAANVNVTITCVMPSPGTSAAAATSLYFVNGNEYGSLGGSNEGWLANVLEYPANSSGSTPATAVITSLNLTDRYFCVATDSSGNIYVAVHAAFFVTPAQSKVLMFASTANGMATPTRTIPTAGQPTALALDGDGNIYVVNANVATNGQPSSYSILEFTAGASGNANPIRTIDVPSGCANLAVDTNRNILCVPLGGVNGPSNEIQVFKSDQSGNATPARTLALDSTVQIIDMGVDPYSNIYVAVTSNPGPKLLEVPGGAAGAGVATPVAGIPDETLANFTVSNLRLDAAGNLYLLGVAQSGGQTVLRFAPGPDGFGPPVSETLVSPVFPTGFGDPAVQAGFALN